MAKIPFKALPDGYRIRAILTELVNHSDREAAIVGLALAEGILARALKARFVSEDDHERPFRSTGGVLGTFYALTTIAYHFGLIPKSLKLDLERLGNIRNRFAHDIEQHTFESTTADFDFSRECRSLTLPDNYAEVLSWVASDRLEDIEQEDGSGPPGIIILDPSGNAVTALFDESEKLNSKKRYLLTIKLLIPIMELHSLRPREACPRR